MGGHAGTSAREAGFSLVEMLVTMLLLTIVLGAVVGISSDSTKRAQVDLARSETIGAAQSGLTRMIRELRQACAILPFQTGVARFCGAAFTPAAVGGASTVASSCPAGTAISNCIDFLVRGRTTVDRSTTPPTTTRELRRVRYDCTIANANQTTRCERAIGTPVTVTSTTTAESAAGALAVAPPASASAPGVVLVNSVLNSGGAPAPIFTYLLRDGSTTTSPAPDTANALRITLRVGRRGERRAGLRGGIYFQSGVELKNLAKDLDAGAPTP